MFYALRSDDVLKMAGLLALARVYTLRVITHISHDLFETRGGYIKGLTIFGELVTCLKMEDASRRNGYDITPKSARVLYYLLTRVFIA